MCTAALAVLTTLAWPLFGAPAHSQTGTPLPPGNITLVVGFPAGGPLDSVARLFAERFGAKHGRTVVVENRPGAAGNVAAASLVRAEPNGLTWMLTLDSVWTVNPHLGAKPPFDVDNDMAPVGRLGQVPLVLAIHGKVPAKTWAELVAHSKTKSLNFGSAGNGSPGHLAFEYLKMVAPFDAVHVPYRGNAPVVTDLIAGNIDGAFVAPGSMLDHFKAGTVRGLAVSDSKRMTQLPDVVTAKEAGLGDLAAIFSNVLVLPAKAPEAVRRFLAGEMKEFVAQADVVAKLAVAGTEPIATDESEARAWFAAERERWGKVVKARAIEVKK
jgi:tripartite-type tricarboxylate transporter receptor subunit TctC